MRDEDTWGKEERGEERKGEKERKGQVEEEKDRNKINRRENKEK